MVARYDHRVRRIYLDHNATTPLDPRVIEAMRPCLEQDFGNPSSLHWFGQRSRAVVEDARAAVAGLVGGDPAEIVFLSGGTEADNLALRGLTSAARPGRQRILVGGMEHHAVLDTARSLEGRGAHFETVATTTGGVLDLVDLERRLSNDVLVVAIMLANNETGVIQPVAEAARLAHAVGAFVLCDAVQAAGKIEVDVRTLDVDLLALSAHKMSGPKGAGALWIRRGTPMHRQTDGGGQERNRRGGTENVPGIAGFGRAATLAQDEHLARMAGVATLRDRLEERILALPDTCVNGAGPRLANTTNIAFGGVEAESLLLALDLEGVAVSTGAACAAGATEPSHVLRAMGLSPERVESSLRFSLGTTTTAEEVDEARRDRGPGVRTHPAGPGVPLRDGPNRRATRPSKAEPQGRRCPTERAPPRGRTTGRGVPTPRERSLGRRRTHESRRTPRERSTERWADVPHSGAGTGPR